MKKLFSLVLSLIIAYGMVSFGSSEVSADIELPFVPIEDLEDQNNEPSENITEFPGETAAVTEAETPAPVPEPIPEPELPVLNNQDDTFDENPAVTEKNENGNSAAVNNSNNDSDNIAHDENNEEKPAVQNEAPSAENLPADDQSDDSVSPVAQEDAVNNAAPEAADGNTNEKVSESAVSSTSVTSALTAASPLTGGKNVSAVVTLLVSVTAVIIAVSVFIIFRRARKDEG